MSESHSRRTSYKRIRPWRWILPVVAVFATGFIYWADDRVRSSPSISGFYPANATWVVRCDNLPRFWLHAQQTPELMNVISERPELFDRLELQARQAVGIRPSPLRWSIWLGKRFVAAESPEGIGVCVYPGLLTRSLAWIYELSTSPNNDVYRVGSLYYGWREGHLIASNTILYVQAALDGPRLNDADRPLGPFEAQLSWGAEMGNQIRVAATDGLPVSGHLVDQFTSRTAPLSLTDAWPSSPLFAVTASRWADMITAYGQVRGLLSLYDQWPVLESFVSLLWDEWQLGTLPSDWERSAGITEMTLAITAIDTSEVFPSPQGVIVLRTPETTAGKNHPLEPLVTSLQSIPHEWQSQQGEYVPLLGEKLSLCLGENATDFVAANSETAMEQALSSLRHGQLADADLTIRMNWGAVGSAMAGILRTAAEYELVPGRNREEVTDNIAPQLEAMGPLGELTIVGKVKEDRLLFQGKLCRRVEIPAP